jgi:hypothetical protein
MVDDGTCDPCMGGLCYLCAQPVEWATDDDGVSLACCCDEHYHLGHAEPPEVEQ